MVILSLSPRSYVTESFDILYNPFSEFIFKALSGAGSDWWNKYFHKTKHDVFNDRQVRLSKKGSLNEIREHYDELALFKLFSCSPIKVAFLSKPEIIKLSNKLHKIRNEWAHRGFPHSYPWANDALQAMIKLSIEIGSTDTADKISVLREKMLIDKKNRDRDFISTATELKQFLEDRIFKKNEKTLNAAPEGISAKEVSDALAKIKRCRDALDDITSPEGVVAFFWNAIIYKNYSYETTRKFGVTFEDMRDEFDLACFGSQKKS